MTQLDITDSGVSAFVGKLIIGTFKLQLIHLKGIFYSLVLDVGMNDKIIMVEPNGTEKQKWYFDDDFTIRNEQGMVLDIPKGSKEAGTPVIAFKKHGGPNQKFRIVPINKIK